MQYSPPTTLSVNFTVQPPYHNLTCLMISPGKSQANGCKGSMNGERDTHGRLGGMTQVQNFSGCHRDFRSAHAMHQFAHVCRQTLTQLPYKAIFPGGLSFHATANLTQFFPIYPSCKPYYWLFILTLAHKSNLIRRSAPTVNHISKQNFHCACHEEAASYS